MHLVDRNGCRQVLPFRALRHPVSVCPRKLRRSGHDRPGSGRQFGLPRQRVRLPDKRCAIGIHDGVFVDFAGPKIGNKQLPCSGLRAEPHRVAAWIPGIEAADDGNAARVRGPRCEHHAFYARKCAQVRSELERQIEIASLRDQMKLKIREEQAKRIGVRILDHAARPGDLQRVIGIGLNQGLEQAGFSLDKGTSGAVSHQRHRCGTGQEGTHDEAVAEWMPAQDRKRIAMTGGLQRLDILTGEGAGKRRRWKWRRF